MTYVPYQSVVTNGSLKQWDTLRGLQSWRRSSLAARPVLISQIIPAWITGRRSMLTSTRRCSSLTSAEDPTWCPRQLPPTDGTLTHVRMLVNHTCTTYSSHEWVRQKSWSHLCVLPITRTPPLPNAIEYVIGSIIWWSLTMCCLFGAP